MRGCASLTGTSIACILSFECGISAAHPEIQRMTKSLVSKRTSIGVTQKSIACRFAGLAVALVRIATAATTKESRQKVLKAGDLPSPERPGDSMGPFECAGRKASFKSGANPKQFNLDYRILWCRTTRQQDTGKAFMDDLTVVLRQPELSDFSAQPRSTTVQQFRTSVQPALDATMNWKGEFEWLFVAPDGSLHPVNDWNAQLSSFPTSAANTVTFTLKPPASTSSAADFGLPKRPAGNLSKAEVLAAYYKGKSVACYADRSSTHKFTSSASFAALRRNHRWPFVDKTVAIAKVLAGSRKFFFNRPSRFGKSLTLSIMLHMLACGEGGLDVRTEFEGTEILEAITTHDNYLGESELFNDAQLVLSITLARPCEDYNKYIIEQLANQARLFLDSAAVDKVECQETPFYAVMCLSSYLPPDLQVSILVDEYDAAITHHLERGEADRAEAVVKALSSLLMISKDTLATGDRISHVIVMGTVDVAQMNHFLGVNNFCDFTHDAAAGEMMGFTEADVRRYVNVESFSKTVKLPVDTIINTWRLRYGGYCFDGCTTYFNPYGVLADIYHGSLSSHREMVLPRATKNFTLYGIGYKAIVHGLYRSMRPGFSGRYDGRLLVENVYELLLDTGVISIIPDPVEAEILKMSANKVERVDVALRGSRVYVPNTLAYSVLTEVLKVGTAELLGEDYSPPLESFRKAMHAALANRDVTTFSQLLKEHVQAVPVRWRMLEALRGSVIHSYVTCALHSLGDIPGITISAELAVATGFVALRISFMADTMRPKETWIIEFGLGLHEYAEGQTYQAFLDPMDLHNPLKVCTATMQIRDLTRVTAHAINARKAQTARPRDDELMVESACMLKLTWYDAVPLETVSQDGRAKYNFKLAPIRCNERISALLEHTES